MSAEFYKNFPSKKFLLNIAKVTNRLNQIGNGKLAGQAYEEMRERVRQHEKDKKFRLDFDGFKQVRLAVAVVAQEPGQLKRTIDNGCWAEFIKQIQNFIQDDTSQKERICKYLLRLYYQHYFTFDKSNLDFLKNEKSVLLSYLKQLLADYNGRNQMCVQARNHSDFVSGNWAKVLLQFEEKTLTEIEQQLCLNTEQEIFKKFRILRLLQRIEGLRANESNARVSTLFKDVLESRHAPSYIKSRTLLEHVVHLLLNKCMKATSMVQSWQDFVFEVGDPRASRHQLVWHRIGNDQKKWLISLLSQGDLREFLETMTDGQDEEIYKYRKQFWLQYVDYAKNAKIMLGKIALRRLKQNNPEMAKRFISSPETYSRLNESERSCVYIEFESFCVIEGTHSAKLRIYNKIPIDLHREFYEYTDFYNTELSKSALTTDYIHAGSEDYSWQARVREFLNEAIPFFPFEDIVLEEDRGPRRLAKIKNRLKASGKDSD
jgi:hypothetical protein